MNPEKVGKQIAKRILMEEEMTKVSIYPGAFKPPHKGHVETALRSMDDKTNKVIIFMSTKERENIDVEEAKQVWDLYKANIPELEKVEIQLTPTPVKSVYDYAKDNPTHDIRAVFGKGEEERFKSLLDKEKYPHVEVFDAGTVGDFSATTLRQAIRDKDLETIRDYIPYLINVDDFLNIFQLNEAIVGDKIVCDNCGWEWKIKDGGDDLFICHKCGYDNNPLDEGLYPRYDYRKVKQVRYKASDVRTNDPDALEEDPKKGTGKKPKGSGRRLYTDEDPSDTVKVKFSTRQDIVDTLGKTSFKNKSHARQSQVINLIHQRVRAALGRTKDPLKKAKLKSAFEYIKKRKEASKKKTQRLKKQKTNEGVLSQTSLVLPRGKKIVLQAEEQDYDRGLIVELTEEGGYKIYYWYGEDIKIYPAEVLVDGESIKPDAREVYIKFHPELEKENIEEGDKYLQEARYKKFLNEAWDDSKAKIINRFMDFATDYLSIDRPKIKLINQEGYTQEYKSFGGYLPSEEKIFVVVRNRNMADILRTLAHEMVHHMQNLDGRLTPTSGEDGSPDENEANSLAAVLMRKFGRENPDIYE
tara:strand:+ start:1317 stop:3068 length:1752 start_codon:yes stop_codon:yes gene_type:complete